MLEKARSFNSDIIMYDLEDSVPPNEKVTARNMATKWVPELQNAGRRVMVRCNALDTGLTHEEIGAVMSPSLYGISVGKTESTWDIKEIDAIITSAERTSGLDIGTIKLIPWIESAKAVRNVDGMSTASSRIIAIAFGGEDYTNDMGVQRTDQGEEVYVPRANVAIAARAADIISLDGPYVAFQNPEGLRDDAKLAQQLGYKGKFAIHPSQIDIINATFSPSSEDVEYAKRVIKEWEKAESEGRGSLNLDGKMVDVPVVKRAENLLALVAQINSQG
jgi:citrate lyase subunit beta/citryl-CoA lyase